MNTRSRISLVAPAMLGLSTLGISLLLVPPRAVADSLDAIFARGNECFYAGDFDCAIGEYERLVELGVRDPDVFYDLGSAYGRADRLGRAVAAFERSLALEPGNLDALGGLDRARSILARRRAEAVGEAVIDQGQSAAQAVFGGLSVDFLAWGWIAFELSFCLALLGWWFSKQANRRLAYAVATPLFAIAMIVFAFGFAIRRGVFERGTIAIAIRDVTVREGPSLNTDASGRIDEGRRVTVIGEDRSWRAVQGDDVEGWVLADSLVSIE